MAEFEREVRYRVPPAQWLRRAWIREATPGYIGTTLLLTAVVLLLPVVSLLGPLTISSITSALVTETIFSLPGIGKLIVNGAGNRDYTLVLGLVVLITVIAVLLNLLVDLAYAALDPKIRY